MDAIVLFPCHKVPVVWYTLSLTCGGCVAWMPLSCFPAIRFLWSGIPYPSHVGAVLYGCHCLVSCHKVPVGRCALVAGTASSDLDLRCSPCECVWNRLHCSWLAVHGLRHSTGMYACTYTHLYAHTYTHTHIYMHVRAHIYMYACIRDLKGGQLPSLPPGPLNPLLMHTHCIYCTCTCSMIIAGCLAVPVQLSDFTVESGEYIHHTCDLSSTYDLSHDLHVRLCMCLCPCLCVCRKWTMSLCILVNLEVHAMLQAMR